jgi:AraC family transcriptional regulator, transcriptional activator of the genes for pyochelin and ferripyochelin receptors
MIMPFKFTESTFHELWQQAEEQGKAFCPDTEVDFIDRGILPYIGRLYQCCTPLQDSLSITIREWEMAESVLHSGCEESNSSEIGLIFNLSGKVQTHHHGLTEEIPEFVGYYQLEHSNLPETELWAVGEPFRRIYLNFDPVRLFENFSFSDRIIPEIRQLLEGNNYRFYRSQPITPQIDRVLQQILHCPYTGFLKQTYFYGKAWELITLTFEKLGEGISVSSAKFLKPSEIEKIHQAREILIDNLNNPPSLSSLARQASLNEFSLKQGFKQVFGTTVFRYLLEHRLEIARQLLVSSDLNIQIIAQQVGFANRSYFAQVFRQKFGLNPKRYRQQRKNS